MMRLGKTNHLGHGRPKVGNSGKDDKYQTPYLHMRLFLAKWTTILEDFRFIFRLIFYTTRRLPLNREMHD
jgi:hypothetical protein